jgi:hypothetical protein
MTGATIGHNNPPIPFFGWLMALLASKLTPAEKVTTLAAIVLQTGKIADISEATSIPERTVEDCCYRPAREGWLHISGPKGGRGVSRIYKPGLPGNPAPVLFDISIDWKPTLQRVRSFLETYGNPAETYGEKLRENGSITNTTTTNTDGVGVTEGRGALLKIAEGIKDRLQREDAGQNLNTASAGLENLSDLLGWMQNGADPEFDIEQPIRNKLRHLRAKKSHQKIHTWHYFSHVVSEAKARREKGLPAVEQANGNSAATNHTKAERSRFANKTFVTDPDGNDDLIGGGRRATSWKRLAATSLTSKLSER